LLSALAFVWTVLSSDHAPRQANDPRRGPACAVGAFVIAKRLAHTQLQTATSKLQGRPLRPISAKPQLVILPLHEVMPAKDQQFGRRPHRNIYSHQIVHFRRKSCPDEDRIAGKIDRRFGKILEERMIGWGHSNHQPAIAECDGTWWQIGRSDSSDRSRPSHGYERQSQQTQDRVVFLVFVVFHRDFLFADAGSADPAEASILIFILPICFVSPSVIEPPEWSPRPAMEGPCRPRQFSSEGRAICPSPLYEVLLVTLAELTFRRVDFVHTKDLRREVAEPVDKRSARKVCNRGGFRPIGKTSSN